jgi:hypothetical protein
MFDWCLCAGLSEDKYFIQKGAKNGKQGTRKRKRQG